MRALVGAFNQEKALVGGFSVDNRWIVCSSTANTIHLPTLASLHPGVINSGHLQRPNWAEKKSVVPTAQEDGGQLQVNEALFVKLLAFSVDYSQVIYLLTSMTFVV